MFREESNSRDDAYSSLRHMAYSIWLTRAVEDPDACLMTMLTSYYDDSGHYEAPDWPSNTKVLLLCGLVAPIDQWLAFERDWKIVLGLPQFELEYFHMKELRQAKEGPWVKFKDNLPLQTDLFTRLQLVIKVRALRSIGGCVVLSDWDKLNEEYELAEKYTSPAVTAGTLAIHKTLRWKEKCRPNDEIKFVVDQGMSGFGQLDDQVLEEYGFRLQPACAKKTPPLQGCDFAAWEWNRQLSTGGVTDVSKMRKSLLSFLTHLDGRAEWHLLDEQGMRETFDKIGYPPRRR